MRHLIGRYNKIKFDWSFELIHGIYTGSPLLVVEWGILKEESHCLQFFYIPGLKISHFESKCRNKECGWSMFIITLMGFVCVFNHFCDSFLEIWALICFEHLRSLIDIYFNVLLPIIWIGTWKLLELHTCRVVFKLTMGTYAKEKLVKLDCKWDNFATKIQNSCFNTQ